MAETTLHIWTHPDLSLVNALSAAGKTGAIALVYTPTTCRFAILNETRLEDDTGVAVDLDQVFELRCFVAGAELRWLRDAQRNGPGRAVLLSETTDGPTDWTSSHIDGLIGHTNHYLLWGQAMETKPDADTVPSGWVVLASARIGELPVPHSGRLEPGQGLRLVTTEYLGLAPEGTAARRHGNWVVRAERLHELKPYGSPRSSTAPADAQSAPEARP